MSLTQVRLEEGSQSSEDTEHLDPKEGDTEELHEEMDQAGDREGKYVCPFSRQRPGARHLCEDFGDKGRKTKAAVHPSLKINS